jgi:hypothetical protein
MSAKDKTKPFLTVSFDISEAVAKAEAKEAKARHDAEIAAINHGDPYISIADMEELWAECGNVPFLGLSVGDHVWFTEGGDVEYEVVKGSKGVTVVSVKTGAPPPFPVAYNITESFHPLGIAQPDISRIVYGVGDREYLASNTAIATEAWTLNKIAENAKRLDRYLFAPK